MWAIFTVKDRCTWNGLWHVINLVLNRFWRSYNDFLRSSVVMFDLRDAHGVLGWDKPSCGLFESLLVYHCYFPVILYHGLYSLSILTLNFWGYFGLHSHLFTFFTHHSGKMSKWTHMLLFIQILEHSIGDTLQEGARLFPCVFCFF